MKILWVMNKQLDTASDRAYISILTKHLEAFGISTTVVARYKKDRLKYDGNILYLKTLSFRFLKVLSYMIQVAFGIPRLLQKSQADVVVVDRPWMVFSFMPYVFLRKRKLTKGARIVLDVRSLPNNTSKGLVGKMNNMLFLFGLKLAGRYFDGCMAITKPMAEYLTSNSKFKIQNIGLWSSAFDATIFQPQTADIAQGLEDSSLITFIYHGAIVENRLLLEVVSAFAKIPQNSRLVLLGDGKLLPELKQLARDSNLAERLIFIDPVTYDEVPPYLKLADIGIVPIANNLWFNVSMPIKLLEYMAMGLPIVAPLTPPVQDVTSNSDCDLSIFKHATDFETQVTNIEKALNLAVSNFGKGYFSEKNREIVLKRYTWSNQAKNINDYLSSLAN